VMNICKNQFVESTNYAN